MTKRVGISFCLPRAKCYKKIPYIPVPVSFSSLNFFVICAICLHRCLVKDQLFYWHHGQNLCVL